MIEINWSTFKQSFGYYFLYQENDHYYEIYSIDGSLSFYCKIIKTTPGNSDQNDFENNYKSLARTSLSSGLVKSKKYDINSQIYYNGENQDFNSLDTDSTWKISRTVRLGNETTTLWANNGLYTAKWSDKESYFPLPGLANAYSTNFDGINDFVSFGDKFLFDRTNQFSMSFWLKPDNISAQRCFYSKVTADANVYGISFQIDVLGRIWTQWRSSGGSLVNWAGTTLSIVPAAWNHVVITYNGSSNQNGIRAYINNVVEDTPGSSAFSGTWLTGQTAMIGQRNGSFHWVGLIDEVSIWNKALSASEVNELYNAASPSDLNNHSAFGNLVNFYRMGDNDIFPIIYDNRGSVNGTCINMQSDDFVEDVP